MTGMQTAKTINPISIINGTTIGNPKVQTTIKGKPNKAFFVKVPSSMPQHMMSIPMNNDKIPSIIGPMIKSAISIVRYHLTRK